jgi:flagellar basal-body rod protein FlgB
VQGELKVLSWLRGAKKVIEASTSANPLNPHLNYSLIPSTNLADGFDMIGKTPQIDWLTRVLDFTHLRHAVIAQNLANINTPNYRRLDVPFSVETFIKKGALAPTKVVVEEGKSAERLDGNNVDIDAEIALLQRNSLLAAATTQILAQQLMQLRSAIVGR